MPPSLFSRSWGMYNSFDMLAVALLPSGLSIAAALSTANGSARLAGLGSSGPSCSMSDFPARYGLHSPDGASYAEVEAVWFEVGRAKQVGRFA